VELYPGVYWQRTEYQMNQTVNGIGNLLCDCIVVARDLDQPSDMI
jgi:hypothetical protein